jgi:ABC-type antimicrobial peptide transport system permease subunit
LTDAQAVLDLPGRINQIMALGCNCAGSDLANIRGQLATVLPETRITEFRSIALARAEQREEVKAKSKEILDQVKESREAVQGMMGGLFQVLTPVVVIACAIWIGLLSLANVRQRRMEIGLFRAIGKGSAMIASLFLGKAVLLGALGGLIGYFFGDWTARVLGVKAFEIGPGQFQLSGSLLAAVLVGAPLLSAVAAYLPALVAIHQDPAVVLRDQ